jgi:hypothetical protein
MKKRFLFVVLEFWNFGGASSECFVIIGNIAHACCCGRSLNLQESVVKVQSSLSSSLVFLWFIQICFLLDS